MYMYTYCKHAPLCEALSSMTFLVLSPECSNVVGYYHSWENLCYFGSEFFRHMNHHRTLIQSVFYLKCSYIPKCLGHDMGIGASRIYAQRDLHVQFFFSWSNPESCNLSSSQFRIIYTCQTDSNLQQSCIEFGMIHLCQTERQSCGYVNSLGSENNNPSSSLSVEAHLQLIISHTHTWWV